MENSMRVPQKIKNRTTIWSSNSTSGYLAEKMKTLTQKDIYTPIFITALFTTAKIWKPAKFLLLEEWIRKMWYTYNGILFSHKKNEILPILTTWMDLTGILLSEISQTEIQVPYDHLKEENINPKLIDTENWLVVARGGGWWWWGE